MIVPVNDKTCSLKNGKTTSRGPKQLSRVRNDSPLMKQWGPDATDVKIQGSQLWKGISPRILENIRKRSSLAISSREKTREPVFFYYKGRKNKEKQKEKWGKWAGR